MNKSTVILNKNERVMEAADHFKIDLNDVEDGHLDHLQTIKDRHDNAFIKGSVRTYRVTEGGVVAFLNASGDLI